MPPNSRGESVEELAKDVSDGFAAVMQSLHARDRKLDDAVELAGTIERKVESDLVPSIKRFMHLVDGNGVPPLAVRLAVAEQTIKRHDEQFAAQRNWIAGLSVGLILAVAGAVVTLVLK